MGVGKLGHGSQLNNVSDQGHIGGPVDGAPAIQRKALASPVHVPTISLNGTRLNGVAVTPNHVTHVLGRAAIMKRVNIGTSVAPVWVEIIALCDNNDPIDGKLLTVDDDGRGTIGQVGMNLEFEVPSTYNLLKNNGLGSGSDVVANYHIGRRVIGAREGMIKPIGLPGALAADANAAAVRIYLLDKRFWDMARGKITRVIPNGTTGGKLYVDLWVDGDAA